MAFSVTSCIHLLLLLRISFLQPSVPLTLKSRRMRLVWKWLIKGMGRLVFAQTLVEEVFVHSLFSTRRIHAQSV